jgi:hypothetical protein
MKQMIGTHLSLGQKLSIVRALLNIVKLLLLISLYWKHAFEG